MTLFHSTGTVCAVVALLSILACTESRSEVSMRLSSPAAPFEASVSPRDSQETQKAQQAQVVEREIIFGSKKLIINPGGAMLFTGDGKILCDIYFYVKTDRVAFLTNKHCKEVPQEWSRKSVGLSSSTYDQIQKQFIITGDFPLLVSQSGETIKGSFKQTIQLLPTGKVKVSIDWKIPEVHKKAFKGRAVFVKCSYSEDYSVSGKKYDFTDDVKGFTTPAAIHFSPKSASSDFLIEVLSPGMARVVKNKRRDKLMSIYPRNDNSNSVTFLLDPGKTTIRSSAERLHGGVDFERSDDLELPNYSICRNLLQNPSFERGTMYCLPRKLGFYAAGIDSIEAVDDEALFGKHSLKITLDTPFQMLLSPVPVEPGKYVFSYYVKGDGSKDQKMLCYVFDTMHSNLARHMVGVSNEWKRIVVPFDVKKNTAVVCDLIPFGPKDSAIYIDGAQLEKGDKASDFTSPEIESMLITSQPDNFFSPDTAINANLRVYSLKPKASGKVKVTVRDFFGTERFSEEFPFTTDQDASALIKLPFDGRFGNGVYVVKTEFTMENGWKSYDFFRFSIMPFLKNKHKLKRLFTNVYNSGDKIVYPGLETLYKRHRQIGSGSEPAGFASDEFAALCEKYGIELIDVPITNLLYDKNKRDYVSDAQGRKFFAIYDKRDKRDKNRELYIKDFRLEGDGKMTDEYVRRFSEVVAKIGKKYPAVPYWSFSKETWAKWPELMRSDLASVADLHVAFYKAIKKANPKAKVYNGAPCNFYPENGVRRVESLLKAIDGRIKFDALAIHTYLTAGPYSFDEYVKVFLDMTSKYGYEKTPVFFPEGMHYGPYDIPQWGNTCSWGGATWPCGTLSYDMGWTEKMTTAWFARTWLVCMKYMDRVFSATSGILNRPGYFNLDSKLTPRAYQKIPNTLGCLLGNSRFVEDVTFTPETKCLIFEDEKQRPVAAVWSQIEKVDRGFEKAPWACATFQDKALEIFDLMQTKREAKLDVDGTLRFPVSPFPFFIRGDSGTTKDFCDSLRNAKMVGGDHMPLTFIAKPVRSDSVRISVMNHIARNVKGSIKALEVDQKIDIPPNGKVAVDIKTPNTLAPDKITNVKIPVSIREAGDAGELSKTIDFNGFTCEKASIPIQIDGDEKDWSKIPAIPLKNRTLRNKKGKNILHEQHGYEGDLEGSFKVAWDDKHLYLLVKVIDDVFTHTTQDKKTESRWDNDSLQIHIDTKCDARQRQRIGYDANDYDYAVFPGEAGDSSIVYRYLTPDIQLTLGPEAPPNHTIASDIPSAFKRTSDGYIYEVAFPAKYLLPVILENNYALGFSLYINDRDRGAKSKQALTLTPAGTGSHRNPHLYPVMLLTE